MSASFFLPHASDIDILLENYPAIHEWVSITLVYPKSSVHQVTFALTYSKKLKS